jgi:hypothetical protein
MNYRCMTIVCTLILFIVLTGCGKSDKQESLGLAVDPLAETVAIPSEYATEALDKTGGLVEWGKVNQIQLKCIVTFFNKDAGYYLTEQSHKIYPWSNSIVITGKESKENYSWQLSNGKFDILKGSEQLANFENQIDSGCFASAILDLMIAPVRLIDKSFVYTRDSTEVNIQGQRCYPITVSRPENTKLLESVYNTVYYQNRVSSMVDMVLLTSRSNNSSFLACGYDYKEIKNGGISIPYRIDIHLAGKDGASLRQLFRIDISSAK